MVQQTVLDNIALHYEMHCPSQSLVDCLVWWVLYTSIKNEKGRKKWNRLKCRWGQLEEISLTCFPFKLQQQFYIFSWSTSLGQTLIEEGRGSRIFGDNVPKFPTFCNFAAGQVQVDSLAHVQTRVHSLRTYFTKRSGLDVLKINMVKKGCDLASVFLCKYKKTWENPS